MNKAVLAALVAAACGGDSDKGRVRLVHASPDAPAVELLIDDSKAADSVSFMTASRYAEVEPGAHRVRVRPAGGASELVATGHIFAKGHDDGFIVAGRLPQLALVGTIDDNSAPASGNAKLRIVHAAPSGPALDVSVVGAIPSAPAAPFVENLPFREASPYLSLPAGDYPVRARQAGTSNVVLDVGTISLAAGQIRTIVAFDVSGGASLAAAVIADRN